MGILFKHTVLFCRLSNNTRSLRSLLLQRLEFLLQALHFRLHWKSGVRLKGLSEGRTCEGNFVRSIEILLLVPGRHGIKDARLLGSRAMTSFVYNTVYRYRYLGYISISRTTF